VQVNFFIAGVQKSGTTALDTIMRRHPQIEMASQKEPHFFDNETIDWKAPDYAGLHRFYDASRSVLARGEATPIYTYWPHSIERLWRYNPAARLIVGLRHPAFRAFSHWRMETTRGAETLSFSEAVREGRRRVAEAPGGVHRVYSYVERGFYGSQIERMFEMLTPQQVLFIRTDQFWISPQETMRTVTDFLDLTPADLTGGGEYIVPLASGDDAVINENDRRYLTNLFTDEIALAARLAGLDLSDWLAPHYQEPMVRG
jgi:hypothetical protein